MAVRCVRVAVVLAVITTPWAGCKLKSDAVPGDAGGVIDAPVDLDAAPDAPPDGQSDVGCSGVDNDVVMYLTMNKANVTIWPDVVGDHDARTAPGTTGSLEPPIPDCGRAYEARTNVTMTVTDSPDFDLTEGSLDFWALVPPPGVERGIVSRDASGQALPGHLDVRFDDLDRVVVRMQDDTAVSTYRCSTAQAEGTWVFIGINFGPPDLELFVDGTLAQEATANHNLVAQTCNAEVFTLGIAGNDNPWALSHSIINSAEGAATPAENALATGIDEFRLSRVRRSY